MVTNECPETFFKTKAEWAGFDKMIFVSVRPASLVSVRIFVCPQCYLSTGKT